MRFWGNPTLVCIWGAVKDHRTLSYKYAPLFIGNGKTKSLNTQDMYDVIRFKKKIESIYLVGRRRFDSDHVNTL